MTDEDAASRPARARRTPLEAVRWWWDTRVRSWWTVRLPAARRRRTTVPALAFEHAGDALGDAREGGVTAILTVYKRGEYLAAQIEALRAQSVPPEEIWVWCNEAGQPFEDVSALVERVVVSNSNWTFWGRFAIANLVRTEHVALYDDDVLPGPDWHASCLETIASGHDGILGGSGVVLPLAGGYSSKHKVGWNGHHLDGVAEVDLVGHAWFFRKVHLRHLWAEPPLSWQNGEDIHFGCMALRHGGVRTWVPPHPEGERGRWSCRPDFGKRVGRTSTATFKSAGHHSVRDDMVNAYRAAGWRILAERSSDTDEANAAMSDAREVGTGEADALEARAGETETGETEVGEAKADERRRDARVDREASEPAPTDGTDR